MSLLDRPQALAVAMAYVVVVLAIGVWAARRARTPKDYFIAGGRLGLTVTTLATMSAAFSGFVFLGGPGLTYRLGVGSLWIVLSVGITPVLLCAVAGRGLRRLAATREIFTVPDVIEARFGNRRVTGVAALAVVLGSVGYLAAQLLALGILLETTLGLQSTGLAILLGLGVLLGYSVFGGMLAGVYTDVFQGTLMLVAALAVFLRALSVSGGWEQMTSSIAGSERFGPDFLAPLGRLPLWTAFGYFFVFGVGVLGQPQMLHKFFMLRDEVRLRWMPLTLGVSQAVCLLVWVGVGLAVPALVAQGRMLPPQPLDAAAPSFLLHHTPPLLAGLVVAAVLAAIMSSADSFANLGAAALVRDIPRALGRPLSDELRYGRLATAVVTLAAALLAVGYGDLIALLGTFAFGTFAAALAPTVALGLNWPGLSARAAFASIVTGLGLNLGLELLSRFWPAAGPFARGVPPSALALAASFTVLVAVGLVDSHRRSLAPSGLGAQFEEA